MSYAVSPHLTWLIVKNNNAFLKKKRNIKKHFSTEPGNIPCLSSFKYSGIVQPKSVHITIPQDNRGFVVRTKKPGSFYKPGKSCVREVISGHARSSLKKLRNKLQKNRYRQELTRMALCKASAFLESQKGLKASKGKKKKGKGKEKEKKQPRVKKTKPATS